MDANMGNKNNTLIFNGVTNFDYVFCVAHQ